MPVEMTLIVVLVQTKEILKSASMLPACFAVWGITHVLPTNLAAQEIATRVAVPIYPYATTMVKRVNRVGIVVKPTVT